jgi:hypothetical protein
VNSIQVRHIGTEGMTKCSGIRVKAEMYVNGVKGCSNRVGCRALRQFQKVASREISEK